MNKLTIFGSRHFSYYAKVKEKFESVSKLISQGDENYDGYDNYYKITINLHGDQNPLETMNELCKLVCTKPYKIKTLLDTSIKNCIKYVPSLFYGHKAMKCNFMYYVETVVDGVDTIISVYEESLISKDSETGEIYDTKMLRGYVAFYTKHIKNETVYEDGINEGTILCATNKKTKEKYMYKVVRREGDTVWYCFYYKDDGDFDVVAKKSYVQKQFGRVWGFKTKEGFATFCK